MQVHAFHALSHSAARQHQYEGVRQYLNEHPKSDAHTRSPDVLPTAKRLPLHANVPSTMSATSYAQTQRLTEWVILLGYSAAVIAPIAVKFQFPLGGFLATASAYYAVYDAAQLRREDDSNSM